MTVEWGDDRPRSWLDRVLGLDESGRRRLSGPALGCAIGAGALLLAADVLPWVSIRPSTAAEITQSALYLSQIGGFVLTGYYVGWLGMLALVGVSLVVRADVRRLLVAGGLGWGAGLLVITAGIAREASLGGPFGDAPVASTLGPGVLLAFAAVAVAVLALLLAGRGPRRSTAAVPRRRAPIEPTEPAGPVDLTVTPVDLTVTPGEPNKPGRGGA